MKLVLTPNKPGLYYKLLNRLAEADNSVTPYSRKGYIPFPVVFEKICRNFSINKKEAWECLFLLQEFGFIEIVKFKGIKLNFQEDKNDKKNRRT